MKRTALAVALVVAFFFAPNLLAGGGYGDADRLGAAVRGAFVGYWGSGERDLSPEMQRLVDYWFRYHLAKGAIAGLLLVVLAALGISAWRAYARTGRLRHAGAGTAATALGLLALATVMANAQGAVAPFASLLPMLVDGPADASLAGALGQVRQRLGAGEHTPAIDAMIGDFARYHEAMVVIATVVAAGLVAASVLLWRRFAAAGPAGRRARAVLASFGGLTAALALAVGAVVVANTTVAADPAPALLAFFNGGW
ncbi:hypothetical protein [Dactylosporangium sp. CA-139066]|uniref:hypothetical protein n=1 Tax=Dactylosporangium sp. CA-139066 TaxID=3239930 RepID=UPI003D8C8233